MIPTLVFLFYHTKTYLMTSSSSPVLFSYTVTPQSFRSRIIVSNQKVFPETEIWFCFCWFQSQIRFVQGFHGWKIRLFIRCFVFFCRCFAVVLWLTYWGKMFGWSALAVSTVRLKNLHITATDIRGCVSLRPECSIFFPESLALKYKFPKQIIGHRLVALWEFYLATEKIAC